MRYIFILIMSIFFANANESVFDDVKQTLAQMESGNKKYAVNSRGFLGKYQLGAMSLVEADFVKLENYRALTYTVKTETRAAKVMWKDGYSLKKFLGEDRNWLIAGGKQAFLESDELQDMAMDRLLRKNVTRLQNAGVDLSNPKKAKALLMSAHLGGVKSAIALYKNGTDYKDEYGTSIKKYYQAGSKSQNGIIKFEK
ncbi:putative LysM domain protein [Sulfurovum sp. enrichment culture clone C5]|uniref:Putative LysM domain protein n=1 Tax=Sulfurovum sp. enrichment culture clone C5 TaxID=497650 RepID=A0A0S4XQJ0_9BACT|nr:putative LysM domain protein [Sulfurovum sp. enrichment culture clone C5]